MDEYKGKVKVSERYCPTCKKRKGCIVCGNFPIIRETEMCGPCTFGEADSIDEGDVT
jgi:hypothetical protein